jgi:hypothetical protein
MSERRARRGAEETVKPAAQRSPGRRRKSAARGGSAPAPSSQQAAPAPVAPKSPISPTYEDGDRARPGEAHEPRDRGLRRAMFLAELAEARELRRRVAPRRARAAELHARLLRTFRY